MIVSPSPMMIFSPHMTSRFRYIAEFIGMELAGTSPVLTNDVTEVASYAGVVLNYSASPLATSSYWIKPHGLLEEKGIREQHIVCDDQKEFPVFFNTGGDCGFDLFAAAFYLLSRYEEYLPHATDLYGRYAHEQSLAWREKFLHRPLINEWIHWIANAINTKYAPQGQPALQVHSNRSFRFQPTYDIDEAWSYKHKGWRTWGSALRALLRGKNPRLAARWNVITGKMVDPFDAYGWMDELHGKWDLHPNYFFLVANRNGRYDRHILPQQPAMRQLIQQHQQRYSSIGVHPSWQSGDDPSLLAKEIDTLKAITGHNIDSSRQHFIRFRLPDQYRYLLEAGITKDYSMGYGTINGFRASVASSFAWYDLEREAVTGLTIFPFCYMEANSFYEQQQTPSAALLEMRDYFNRVKKVNGLLIMIWHNTFLGTDPVFAGWRDAYATMVEEIMTASD